MRLSTSHLLCDFSVKGAPVKRCSFPALGSLTASFDWTLGCLNRWQHGEPNQPCNPPLGLPPRCCRTTRRICCTTIPCGSPEKQDHHCSQNLIWKVCWSVCPGSDCCSSLYSHLIQVTLFCLQITQMVQFFLVLIIKMLHHCTCFLFVCFFIWNSKNVVSLCCSSEN